jgi:ABC-type sugar transport system ATPase subunit
MNLIPARYSGGSVIIGGHRVRTAHSDLGERDVIVGIRPGAVRIEDGGIPATVDLVEDLGDSAVLDLDVGGTMVRARVSHGRVPAEGEAVSITASPEDIHLFDATTRKRI